MLQKNSESQISECKTFKLKREHLKIWKTGNIYSKFPIKSLKSYTLSEGNINQLEGWKTIKDTAKLKQVYNTVQENLQNHTYYCIFLL